MQPERSLQQGLVLILGDPAVEPAPRPLAADVEQFDHNIGKIAQRRLVGERGRPAVFVVVVAGHEAVVVGGGDAARELSVGISEALYNTALGIGTSAFAIIMYNVFTTKIDGITYGIDESGFTLTQSFASLYK